MNTKKICLTLGAVLVSAAALAQSFSVDGHTLGGGGGASTGGAFALSGTVGQLDANPQPLTGGTFSLVGGFWSLVALQTPNAPLLSIERQGAEVRVFWPLPAAGFVLDQSLTVTGLWSQVTLPYVTNATEISFSAPAPAGNRFYRLRRP